MLATRDGEEPYKVRAIFDNAGFVIPGEDVKVAGVKVGKIDSLDVTRTSRPSSCSTSRTRPTRTSAATPSASIRPQSLIGEKFVECEPTQARQAERRAAAARWRRSTTGPGEGQYLLPVEQTTKPVDLDLINNITREPQQRAAVDHPQRARAPASPAAASDLNEVIRRANPALKEVDKVLEILASENETLQQLAVDGDTVLAPLARERRRVSSALENSAEVAEATAERRDDLEADIERLPAVPARAAPDDGAPRRVRRRGDAGVRRPRRAGAGDQPLRRPSSARSREAGIPAFESLGDAAEVGTPAMSAALPDHPRPARVRQAGAARRARPASALLGSLQETRGFERFVDYIFYQVAAVNGFDSFGHYLRAGPDRQPVLDLRGHPDPGLLGELRAGERHARPSAAAPSGPRDPVLVATARGDPRARWPASRRRGAAAQADADADAAARARRAGRDATPAPTRRRPRRSASATPAPAAPPTPAPAPTPTPAPPRAATSRCSTTCSGRTRR